MHGHRRRGAAVLARVQGADIAICEEVRRASARQRDSQDACEPFYVGVVEWHGVQYEGQHKPLISRALFERVQEMLKAHDRVGVRGRRHDHYLKGLLRCGECGNRLSLTWAKGKYLYFYCLGQRNALRKRTGCRQPYVLASDCEAMVEEVYRKVQLPEEWAQRLTEELEEEIVERQATAADMRVALTHRIAELADERRKLLRAYYANALPVELLKEEQDRISSPRGVRQG